MRRKARERKTQIHWGILIFRIISLAIICYALLSIWSWYKENKNSSDIQKSVLSDVKNTVTIYTDENNTYKGIDVDFNSLMNKNSETIGWIRIDNLKVDYPIVQTTNNDFYLTHSFDKSYNSAGWIFMDYRCKFDFTSKNTVIYGHNRKDGSMFGSIINMLNPSWYNINQYITIATPTSNKIYKIFSMYNIKAEAYYVTSKFNSDEEYKTFLDTISKRSIFNFNMELTKDDKIITLSTCSGLLNDRTVIHAKLVEDKLQ